ncbi:MAG: hypothetical protein HC861_02225 [Rhodospirillaceae bacterium]|nr:hypothetical protein [Rhodospirillaceae bacterium]
MIAAAMLAIGSGVSPSFAAAQDTGDPKAIVQTFYDALEETMKQGDELGFDGRYKKLEPVIRETFDVPVMAKIAVGPEWTNLKPDEKTKLLEAFDRYMISTYASRFRTDKGLVFQVGEVKTPADNRTLVETKLIRTPRRSGCAQLPVPAGRQRQLEDHRRLSRGAISEMARMRSDFSATVTGGAPRR